MPHEILLNEPVGGYARGDATGPGEIVEVVITEFTSSSEGELFMTRLEGVPLRLLTLLPSRVDPSMINHLIAIIRKDRTATVYVNECDVFAQVRLGRRIEQFENILENDVIEISSMSFHPVEFPPDAGFVCVFSAGWRKGLLFDLSPLHGDQPRRTFDVPKALGAGMSKMIHHDLFTLTDDDWRFIMDEQWFPFATLFRPLRRSLIGMAKRRTDINCLLPRITESVKSMVPHLRLRWSESPILRPHHSLLMHALDEFEEGDSVSCTAILFPRIEGLEIGA